MAGATIQALGGNDTITNSGKNVLFKYSAGNDVITGFNATSTLQIGDGTATYSKETVGSDVVLTVGDNKVTLSGASTLSKLNITGEEVIPVNPLNVMGTNGADSINNTLAGATIQALGGNDTITNSGKNVLFKYSVGNDVITGFNATSTLQIGDGSSTYSKETLGSDVVLTVGNNKVTLSGASTLSKLNITGEEVIPVNPLDVTGTESADKINSSLDGATIQALGGNDSVRNYGDSVSILGGAGNDSIRNYGDSAIMDGGNGADSIRNYGDDVTITCSAGNDTIRNYSENVLFNYAANDGNDVIIGFNETSTISIGNGTASYTKATVGSDIVLTVGDGKITLNGAANLSSVNIAGKEIATTPINETLQTLTDSDASTITIGSAVITADASARSKAIQITGNALNNSIVGGKVADTLTGGAGNDSLTGGYGADMFVYTDGQDVITDYSVAAGDKISIAGDGAKYLSNITGVAIKDNNVKLTFSNDANKTLTINDVAGKKITINGAARYFDNNQIIAYDKKTVTLTSAFSGTFDAGTYSKVDASAVANSATISGGASSGVSIVGGKKADSIGGNAGNDTLTGGYGADTFVYTGGNDVITDYSAGFDKVSLAGDGAKYLSQITGVSVKNKNVTLTFSKDSSKTLTLNGAAGKKVIVNGTTRIFEDGKIYTADKSKYTVASAAADVYWFDENNFDGVQLDSIVDNASDYSLGKLDTNDNLTRLTKDEFILTYGDDK